MCTQGAARSVANRQIPLALRCAGTAVRRDITSFTFVEPMSTAQVSAWACTGSRGLLQHLPLARTATETKALAEGLTPQQICDKYHAIHADIYRWFEIEFDYFGRTTTPKQTEIAQDIFLKCQANGYTSVKTTDQLYSEARQTFLADRFVRGTCPHCGYEDAGGDQCDGCGKLLTPTELIDPVDAVTRTKPVIRQTSHIYLDLAAFQERLVAWVAESSSRGMWTHNSLGITHSWFRKGLQARAITRDLKWGTPVPVEAFKDKVQRW